MKLPDKDKNTILGEIILCHFPECTNKVDISKGLKPCIYCNDPACRKKRHNVEAKRSRDQIKELYRSKFQAFQSGISK